MTDAIEGAVATERPLVRWGVLSAANIGLKAVIPAIQASRNGRLVALASRDLARAERVALAEPGVRAYASYEALLGDPDIDAVYIPLPNALHAEWAIRAAQAGKHVLCEKPLGMTADEVTRMYAAADQAGVVLMEAFMYRFHPQIRWAQEQIAAGRIGAPRVARASFVFDIRRNPENIRLSGPLAGGSLMDVGCYPLSFCRIVFGAPPLALQSVAARVTVPDGSEVERGTYAILDYGAGRIGMFDSSFELPWGQFAEVVGDKGRLLIPRPFTPGRAETVVRIEVGDEVVERHFDAVDHYQLQVEHFGDCVQSGERPYLTQDDATTQAATIEAVYAAAGYRWPLG